MERKFVFFCKLKSKECSPFLNVIYHLGNSSMPCGPFWTGLSLQPNALFNRLVRNTAQHRSLQVNYVFLTKTDIVRSRW